MQSGSCHCGAVQFTVAGEIDRVIECNCSHCSRKGFLFWFVPRKSLTVSAGAGQLTTYTFNRHVIQHQFCSVCGCQPFGLGSMPDGTETAAINVRCLHGVELQTLDREQVNGREF